MWPPRCIRVPTTLSWRPPCATQTPFECLKPRAPLQGSTALFYSPQKPPIQPSSCAIALSSLSSPPSESTKLLFAAANVPYTLVAPSHARPHTLILTRSVPRLSCLAQLAIISVAPACVCGSCAEKLIGTSRPQVYPPAKRKNSHLKMRSKPQHWAKLVVRQRHTEPTLAITDRHAFVITKRPESRHILGGPSPLFSSDASSSAWTGRSFAAHCNRCTRGINRPLSRPCCHIRCVLELQAVFCA